MASAIVGASSVGPVVDSTLRRNGATITMSPLRSSEASRLAVARTMSMRRFMLWLPSMSSVKVVGMSCSCTRSSACGTPSSMSEKSLLLRHEM